MQSLIAISLLTAYSLADVSADTAALDVCTCQATKFLDIPAGQVEITGMPSGTAFQKLGLAYASVILEGEGLKTQTDTPMLVSITKAQNDKVRIAMPALASVQIQSSFSQAIDCQYAPVDITRILLLVAGSAIVLASPVLGSCLRVRSVFLGLTFLFSAAIAVVFIMYYAWQSVGGGGDARNLAIGAMAPLALITVIQQMTGWQFRLEDMTGKDLFPPYQNWLVVLAVVLVVIAVIVATIVTSCVTDRMVQQASSALEVAMFVSGLALAGVSSSMLALNAAIVAVLALAYLAMTCTCFRRGGSGHGEDEGELAPSAEAHEGDKGDENRPKRE